MMLPANSDQPTRIAGPNFHEFISAEASFFFSKPSRSKSKGLWHVPLKFAYFSKRTYSYAGVSANETQSFGRGQEL